MNLLGAILYDPSTAATKATSALLAMTALRFDYCDRWATDKHVAQVAGITHESSNTFPARKSLWAAGVVMVNIEDALAFLHCDATSGAFATLRSQERIENASIDVVQPPRIRFPVTALRSSIQVWIFSTPLALVIAFAFQVFKSILTQVLGTRGYLIPFSMELSVSGAAQIAATFFMDVARVGSVVGHSTIIGQCRAEQHDGMK